MAIGDLVAVDRRLALDVEHRDHGDARGSAEVTAEVGIGDRTDALDPGDPLRRGVSGPAVHVHQDRDGRQQLRPVHVGGVALGWLTVGSRRLGEQLHGGSGVGQDQDRLDPASVVVVGVSSCCEHVGDVLHGGVEPGDHCERGADEEAAHPVLGGPGRVGELPLGRFVLATHRRPPVGGHNRRGDQLLEPRPRDPAVG